jgi:hypothetical protein
MSRWCSLLYFAAGLSLIAAGCNHIQPLDTKPLDAAGVGYASIKKLEALKITSEEVPEISKMRSAGFSDEACVSIVEIYHQRGQPFAAGEALAGLVKASVGENTILELARMDQLGIGAGEFQVMRLAGLSDAIILETAKHEAAGTPSLSGLSLGKLKNSGLRESTLLELEQRGVPDSATDQILAMRRHRATDKEILRKFTGT